MSDLTIQALLHTIQTKMHVGKDKKNDFGGYNYRTAEGILSAMKPHLPEGASINLNDQITEVAGQIFVVSTATLMMADGQSHSAQGAALHPLTKKGMDPSQITGAASSYARKYALCGLAAIDDGKEEIDGAKTPYEPAPIVAPQEVFDAVNGAETIQSLVTVWTSNKQWHADPNFLAAKDERKSELTQKEAA